MIMVAMKAYHPDTGVVHNMDTKNLIDFSAWVDRGRDRGYKPFPAGNGVIRFVSNKPLECATDKHVVFYAKFITNAVCAMDYYRW